MSISSRTLTVKTNRIVLCKDILALFQSGELDQIATQRCVRGCVSQIHTFSNHQDQQDRHKARYAFFVVNAYFLYTRRGGKRPRTTNEILGILAVGLCIQLLDEDSKFSRDLEWLVQNFQKRLQKSSDLRAWFQKYGGLNQAGDLAECYIQWHDHTA